MNRALEICGVSFGLREVFRDIFHPTRSGSLSDFIGWLVSRLLRRTRLRPSVGPIALACVILSWILVLASGFALIYCGVSPRFIVGGADSDFGVRLLRSFYFSLGAFDTFQTFDLTPATNWLRLVIAIEGLIGISMLTASVSWLVLLYPALERMREFTRRVGVWMDAEKRTGISLVRGGGAPLLSELGRGTLQFRLDVILFPILLNFYPSEGTPTIGSLLPSVHRFAMQALAEGAPDDVRLAGAQQEWRC